mmetsp:Transcript_43622/g.113661  ORF Transcript_43622/g.113661 Transcript_43622/m.113661 type:complete len:859 (-) Transcript_43622:130-2706(-)
MNPATNWLRLHDRYYEKFPLYEMGWSDVDIQDCVGVGAQGGGPIALRYKDKKTKSAKENTLRMFSNNGQLLVTVEWEEGRIVDMVWTNNEELVVLTEHGHGFVLTMYGRLLYTFDVGKVVEDELIEKCYMWDDGLAILTMGLKLFVIPHFSSSPEILPYPLTQDDLDEPAMSMTVMPPSISQTKWPEVYLATQDGNVLVVTPDRCYDGSITCGPFKRMSLAKSGQLLALFSVKGKMIVMTSNLQKILSEFDADTPLPPLSVNWCGSDSVVLQWSSTLMNVGPYGDWMRFDFDSDVVLVPESDSIRIVSNSTCELLWKVPDPVVSVFQYGSTSVAATLYDTFELFEKNDITADETFRSIKDDLSSAVDTCIEAALNMFNPIIQKRLMKAAKMGKALCEFYEHDNFMQACDDLRLLNAVRHPSIAMPITHKQFEQSNAAILIERVARRRHHFEAVKMLEARTVKGKVKDPALLGVMDKILLEWAVSKMGSPYLDEEKCAQDIIANLLVYAAADGGKTKRANSTSVSFADVAMKAAELRKKIVAKELLRRETSSANRVPVLLKMGLISEALREAERAEDSDLLYRVLFRIFDENKQDVDVLIPALADAPIAKRLLTSYLIDNKRADEARKIFDNDIVRDPIATGMCFIQHGIDHSSALKGGRINQVQAMQAAEACFADAGKEGMTLSKLADECIRLLDKQSKIETKEPSLVNRLEGRSLRDTIRIATLYRLDAVAKTLKSEFKLSDKRFMCIQLDALAHADRWDDFAKMGNEKKPAAGWRAFAEICIKYEQRQRAVEYIHRVHDASDKVRLFVQIDQYIEAAKAAIDAKNLDLLSLARTRCRDPVSAKKIDAMAAEHGYSA